MKSQATRAMVLTAALLDACARPGHAADAAVQGAAVRELFVTREHARQLVLWVDPGETGPTFELLGAADADTDTGALARPA